MAGISAYSRLPDSTFWRSLQTLNISRVVIALVLLTYLSFNNTRLFWSTGSFLFREACIVYLICAVGFVLLKIYVQRRFMLQLASQAAVDISIISVLYVSSSGAKSGLAILYLFPLAGAAILAPLLWALFFASLVALFLLLESAYHILQLDDGTSLSQAGLFGAAFLSVVYVLNRLSRNLVRQEELAKRRGRELAMQQSINRAVIADMGDGVLVLNPAGYVFEINPAAEHMLGGMFVFGKTYSRLADVAALRPIAEEVAAWHRRTTKGHTTDPNATVVTIRFYDESRQDGLVAESTPRRDFVTHLKLRFMAVDHADISDLSMPATKHTIIFMRDVSEIENQAQQLKLASMGRLTASIAHEVRNPLSSISYAASLLNEDMAQDAQTKRLLKIVDDNVLRLNQLIEDILKLSRKAQTDIKPFQLMPAIHEMVLDLNETRSVAPDLIYVDESISFEVSFDPMHLREIVVNLLSNALRYASGKPGSIKIWANMPALDRKELHVQDDGPGITYEVRSHLFEPFYTTSSQGTGLGLYMARELCLNNHSLLDYEYRVDEALQGNADASGRFVINFSLPDTP